MGGAKRWLSAGMLAIGRYDADLARLSAREPAALEYGINLSLREARTLLDRARRDVEWGVSIQYADPWVR